MHYALLSCSSATGARAVHTFLRASFWTCSFNSKLEPNLLLKLQPSMEQNYYSPTFLLYSQQSSEPASWHMVDDTGKSIWISKNGLTSIVLPKQDLFSSLRFSSKWFVFIMCQSIWHRKEMGLSICFIVYAPLISITSFANRCDNVFLCYRKLYWTDQGTDSGVPAKVASANMDGSGIQTLFTGNLDHVEFITIDIKEQKLYWAVTSTGVVSDTFVIVGVTCLFVCLWFPRLNSVTSAKSE